MKFAGLIAAPLLERSINRTLRLDAHYETVLKPLTGKRLTVKLQDLQLSLTFQATDSAVKVFANGDSSADVIVSGRVIHLLRLGLGAEPQALIKQGLVNIDGDMLVLQAYQHLMQQLDFDWESKLAPLLGDSAAHAIVAPMQRAKTWCHTSRQSTEKDITEYLQEEKQLLPPHEAVEDFYDDIAELRSVLDRLDVQLNALKN